MQATPEAAEAATPPEWGDRIGDLLQELMQTQQDLLAMLSKKRELVLARDNDALRLLHLEEEKLVARLQACCEQRQQLLDQAQEHGMPAQSLERLAGSLPGESRTRLRPGLRDARRQSRLLQHQSLANWVLVQRSLLHLSQMMEIIATGGRMRPTYGKESPNSSGGALVDQIRKQPFSVILLDEFEKSHGNVWDLFLQLFDDGRLTDREGNTADFRNAIVILTSNLGSSVPKGAGEAHEMQVPPATNT